MNTSHRLLHTKYRSNWQETESLSGTWLSLILDPIGIFNGIAKHLKTAADTDDGTTHKRSNPRNFSQSVTAASNASSSMRARFR